MNEINIITSTIKDMGFPIAVCVYLLWFQNKFFFKMESILEKMCVTLNEIKGELKK